MSRRKGQIATQVFAAVEFPGVGDMGDACPERHELRYPREAASVLRSGRGSGYRCRYWVPASSLCLGHGSGYRYTREGGKVQTRRFEKCRIISHIFLRNFLSRHFDKICPPPGVGFTVWIPCQPALPLASPVPFTQRNSEGLMCDSDLRARMWYRHFVPRTSRAF